MLTDFCPRGNTLRNLANGIDAKAHASIVENTAGLFKRTEHGRKEADFRGQQRRAAIVNTQQQKRWMKAGGETSYFFLAFRRLSFFFFRL
jgi:hypothetical protein